MQTNGWSWHNEWCHDRYTTPVAVSSLQNSNLFLYGTMDKRWSEEGYGLQPSELVLLKFHFRSVCQRFYYNNNIQQRALFTPRCICQRWPICWAWNDEELGLLRKLFLYGIRYRSRSEVIKTFSFFFFFFFKNVLVATKGKWTHSAIYQLELDEDKISGRSGSRVSLSSDQR